MTQQAELAKAVAFNDGLHRGMDFRRKENRVQGVYSITNVVSGRVYIGSSKCVRDRLLRHISCLKSKTHPNEILQRAWDRDGEEGFVFALVCQVADEQELLLEEQRQIDLLTLTFNILPAGRAPYREAGWRHTPEAKTKISARTKGRVVSEEGRRRIGAASKGRKQPAEAIARMREGLTGQVRSEEALKNYRAAWGDDRRTKQRSVAAKLSEDQVREIRSRWPAESQRSIAKAFGVSPPTVRSIILRKTWRDTE